MVFSSTVFLFLFLPLTVLIYYNPWWQGRGFRNNFLLLASLFFYAWGEPVFVWLMILSIIVGWRVGLGIERAADRRAKRRLLVVGVAFHVGLFFIFKYLSFTLRELGGLFSVDLAYVDIALPIGISFFTFQLLSYLFDIYYGRAKAQVSVLKVGLYIALFPALIAGPIVRYDWIEREISERRESIDDFAAGMQRFIYGLGKKVLIANYMAQLADNIFNAGVPASMALAWLGAIDYTLQIYFDFSGYSDMAIGLARMFGFHLRENFNYPYIAKSATEFWRRWHISLGSWFRDYVYIPLGGNRVSVPRWVLNLFIVWALTGLWHGANYTFIAWGMLYFTLLMVEKFTGFTAKIGPLAHVYALAAIIIGWVLFRSESIGAAANYISVMLGAGALTDELFFRYLGGSYTVLIVAVILSTPIFPYLRERFTGYRCWSALEPVMTTGIFLLALLLCISGSYNPFIYFNF